MNRVVIASAVAVVVALSAGGYYLFFSQADEPTAMVIKKEKKKLKKPAKDIYVVSPSDFWDQPFIRSPFYAPANVRQKRLSVTGVVYTAIDGRFKVLVNGEIYLTGQSVDGYEILKIKPGEVKVKSLKTRKIQTISVLDGRK